MLVTASTTYSQFFKDWGIFHVEGEIALEQLVNHLDNGIPRGNQNRVQNQKILMRFPPGAYCQEVWRSVVLVLVLGKSFHVCASLKREEVAQCKRDEKLKFH